MFDNAIKMANLMNEEQKILREGPENITWSLPSRFPVCLGAAA